MVSLNSSSPDTPCSFCRKKYNFCQRRGSGLSSKHLCDELAGTAGLGDLLLGVLGEVAGADDDWDTLWETALAEDLAVAVGEEVDDWGGVGGLVGEVLLALLGWDEGPELGGVSTKFSAQGESSNERWKGIGRKLVDSPCRG